MEQVRYHGYVSSFSQAVSHHFVEFVQPAYMEGDDYGRMGPEPSGSAAYMSIALPPTVNLSVKLGMINLLIVDIGLR